MGPTPYHLRIRPADSLLGPVRDAENGNRQEVAQAGQQVSDKAADRPGIGQQSVAAGLIPLNVPEDVGPAPLQKFRKESAVGGQVIVGKAEVGILGGGDGKLQVINDFFGPSRESGRTAA